MRLSNPTPNVNKARINYLINCLRLRVLSAHTVYKSINAEYLKAAKKAHQMHLVY